MRRWALTAAALLVLAGAGGLLVAASGIVPVKASSGHWAITEWLLQFGKRRSLATHTLALDLPALDEPWLVLKGAGHYESGCAPCHGSPVLRTPRIPAAMTPRPPYLPPRIDDYSPEELFYVVKHGIKFTGMPAWPAQQRDDEVRAVVAFLLRMPELDAAGYRRLVHGPVVPSPAVVPLREMPAGSGVPSAVTASCARCHGRDGLGRGNAAFPKLALQKRVYMSFALNAYARSQRNSGIMEPIAAALTPEERRELAAYYSALPAGPPAMMPAPRESRARGEAIAMRGVPERGVPSCMDCHGPSPHPRNPAYPNLAGQYADYIALQLELFAEQRRGGSSYAHIMRQVAARLTQQQRRDVAAYYSALPAGARDGG